MFITTTPKGLEGTYISYSQEEKCAKSLLKTLPEGWNVKFSWAQILFSDVQYQVDKKKKMVEIVYNQNLHIWWSEVIDAVEKSLKTKATPRKVAA